MPFFFGVDSGSGGQNRRTLMLHRGLNLKTPPGGDPITLTQSKLWDRITQDKEDTDLIPTIIAAATRSVESFTRLQLLTAEWEVFYDIFPTMSGDTGGSLGFSSSFSSERFGLIELPKNPLQAVTEIEYTDTTGTPVVLDPSEYTVDIVSKPARITPAFNKFWPATQPGMNAVKITMTCGYGDFEDFDAEPNPVPAGLLQAIQLMSLDMYMHRSAQSDFLLRDNKIINNLLYEFILPSLADVT